MFSMKALLPLHLARPELHSDPDCDKNVQLTGRYEGVTVVAHVNVILLPSCTKANDGTILVVSTPKNDNYCH